MGKPDNTGLRRIANAARFSAQGFAHAWKHEAAFRQEVGITIILVPFALWLGQTPTERLLLIASCALVLIVELLNSAVEAVVDRFGSDYHELSGRAKDLASAAVFISCALVLATWLTIAWQRFA